MIDEWGYVDDEETGLYYLRSRYSNPAWCRFINADTIVLGNQYSYCANSPICQKDASGYWPTTTELDEERALHILGQVIHLNKFFTDPNFIYRYQEGYVIAGQTLSEEDALRINRARENSIQMPDFVEDIIEGLFFIFPEEVTKLEESIENTYEVTAGSYTDYVSMFTIYSRAADGIPIGQLTLKVRQYFGANRDASSVELWGSRLLFLLPSTEQCYFQQTMELSTNVPPSSTSILQMMFTSR